MSEDDLVKRIEKLEQDNQFLKEVADLFLRYVGLVKKE
jgi:hypothetical protein